MKIVTIASGSSGNCVYIGSEKRNILIDAGIPMRRIEAGLAEAGLSANDLDAVFITHEHSDHISGLGSLMRKYELPAYMTEGTHRAITEKKLIGKVEEDFFRIISPEFSYSLGDLDVECFSVSHDAAQPVMYKISDGSSTAAVVTDLGEYDRGIVERLTGLDAVLLETNHDIRMLQTGPYPYYLKQRIMGSRGHLSNEAAAELLGEIYSERLKKVILGHISKTNNYEELAYETIRVESKFIGCGADISVAPRDRASGVIEF
ncbi:MAG: MBL fold metallo-hydrolase [Lachnospiraceae bacterium]|nr:MBL fold metallo-hydrolase [Lachnospiraceae bacterium]